MLRDSSCLCCVMSRKYAHARASDPPTRLTDWTYSPLVALHFAPLAAFDSLSRDTFVAFIEPPSLDARIVNQFALFSLMSGPAASLEAWM